MRLSRILVLGFALASVGMTQADPQETRPLKTSTCIRESPSGQCREYDYTYSLVGASCTEECLTFDGFDSCTLRNKCTFDARSGCFRKRYCIDLGTMDLCKEWRESAVCH